MADYPPEFEQWWLTMRDWLRFCKRSCPDKAGSLREWVKIKPTPSLAAEIVRLAGDKARDYIVSTKAGEFREQPKAPVRWLKSKPWLDQEPQGDKTNENGGPDREWRDIEPIVEAAVKAAKGLGWFDTPHGIPYFYPTTIRLAGRRLAESRRGDGPDVTVQEVLDAARARASKFA